MRERALLFIRALGHALRLLFFGLPPAPQGPPPPTHPNCRCIVASVVTPGNSSRYPNVPRALLYHGVIARTAKRLKISPSFVSRVARGTGTSVRVINALRAEVDRIESSLARRQG